MQTSLPTSYGRLHPQKLNQINQVLGIRAVCVASVEVGEEDLRKGKHAEHQHAVGRYAACTSVCASQFYTESTLGTSSQSLVERSYGHSPLVCNDVEQCSTSLNTIE